MSVEVREIITFYDKNNNNYWLSNYWPHGTKEKFSFKYEEKTWPTSEHLYQALKFKHKNAYEKEWREIIRKANTPTIAKYLGNLHSYVRWPWQKKYSDLVIKYRNYVNVVDDLEKGEVRFNIMYEACKAKFANKELKTKLISTGNSFLGERSYGFWGIKGENRLGEILMLIRNFLILF